MAFIYQKVLAGTHKIKAACKNTSTTLKKKSKCKALSTRGSLAMETLAQESSWISRSCRRPQASEVKPYSWTLLQQAAWKRSCSACPCKQWQIEMSPQIPHKKQMYTWSSLSAWRKGWGSSDTQLWRRKQNWALQWGSPASSSPRGHLVNVGCWGEPKLAVPSTRLTVAGSAACSFLDRPLAQALLWSQMCMQRGLT